jgi:NADH:ubiquinone oxidoreductase subunit 6 (subunit J)
MDDFIGRYGAVVLPVALGFLGIYLLLPRPSRPRSLWGGLAGALALVLGGATLIHSETAFPETVLFYAFSGMAIVSGALMLAQSNPVHAALSFALVVLSTCGLFLLLAAPFLMAATIIVYAGAIVVTFLFVIMLAQQTGLSGADLRSREPFLACLAGFVLVGALLCVLHKTYDTRTLDALLAKVDRVIHAQGPTDIRQALGAPEKFIPGQQTLPILEDLAKNLPDGDVPDLLDAEELLIRMDVMKLKALFERVQDRLRQARLQKGSLQPDSGLPLSRFSGTPPNVPFESARQLPARNVAGLGRALFSDYLLAVELAGTLLLVASIGAIAIAGRRSEGLR